MNQPRKPTVEEINRRGRMAPPPAQQQRDPDAVIEDFALTGLTANDLNKIMAGVTSLPFRDAAPVVKKIEQQIMEFNARIAVREAAEQRQAERDAARPEEPVQPANDPAELNEGTETKGTS